jgi:hypothetical protein
MFDDFPKSCFEVISPEGEVRGSAEGIFAGETVMVSDITLQIFAGDEVRRSLPNGSDDVFTVVDPRFFDAFGGIDAHFQLKVRRKGTFPHRQGGHFINVTGANARVTFGNDSSTNLIVTDVVRGAIQAVENQIGDLEVRSRLIEALEAFGGAKQPAEKSSAYQAVVASAANHMTVLTPFLPALSQLLA